ncbi:uncharacterized protein PAC_00996 [Phialocephala subalpina]|uniref:F-box domain-containing protein n=1 Tax=Phialocephala subalpina TaxID=576137 RepID=A0A1L7WEC1_9HELO|nr:uncharacterized protein PAC_00996 [Phialocephala subalpina]
MTIISYHSTLFSDVASSLVAVDKTSSQILLSRGVAGAQSVSAPCSRSTSPTFVASIFESESIHIMTLGEAASGSRIDSLDGEASSFYRLGGQGTSEDGLTRAEVADKSTPDESTASTSPNPEKPKSPLASCLKRALAPDIEDEDFPRYPSKHARCEDEDDGEEPERGRTLERGLRFSNPLSRAESRSHREDPAIEIDVRPVEKRTISRSNTFFEDPNDPCAILEDALLEPCPPIPLSDPVSEVLSGSPSPRTGGGGRLRATSWVTPKRRFSSREFHPPARAVTTVFNNAQLQAPSPLLTLSPINITRTSTYASHIEVMTVSSSSSVSTIADDGVPDESPSSPPVPLATKLPTEIVQQIFRNLSPGDFNSARHSCRSWFIHSLNKSLLQIMMRRGGISNSAMADVLPTRAIDPKAPSNETWLMSKRLSRECALGPDWLGNGVPMASATGERPSAFVNVTSVDFTEVAVHYPGPDSAGTVFTISNCGRFLMAANGCLVHVYELNRRHRPKEGSFLKSAGHLLPVTSIICPRRVLACSMDTSSHRYAIAILLDGRMGLVCDITTITRHSPSAATTPASTTWRALPGSRASDQTFSESARMQGTSFLDRVSLNSSSSALHSERPSPDAPFVFPGIATTGASFAPVGDSEWQDVFQGDIPESSRTAGPSSRHTSLPRAFIVGRDGQLQDLATSQQEPEQASSSMRIEDGPRSLYRNLCSDDDPPRSVAICPQRRCVAFGCSSGIELHWVDALTGQDLNRWFPLTAPSDFLFFLPPRKSIDSAKKLRLISSAARPSERPAISERSFGSRTLTSPFWERFGWGVNHYVEGEDASSAQGILTRLRIDTGRTSMTGRMDCSDHYRAVPLSDGHHILFTDPATGLLCLGSDAPVGGPTKLLRKIWFKGPEGQGSPIVYSSGSDLSWGVRVVAGFGSGPEQSIWLFSVPKDVFTANQGTQPGSSTPAWFSSTSSREAQNTDWIKWWPDDGLQEWLNHVQDPVPGILPRSIWPVKIRGQKIGTCTGLVDLAIDSGPQMAIWAFIKGGIATVWKLDDGKYDGVKGIWVQRDGTVRESDRDGDVELLDVSLPSPSAVNPAPPFQQQSFDGTSTPASIVSSTRSERRHRIEWSQHMVRYDNDGDVIMDDLEDREASALVERESSEEISWEGAGGEVHYERGWWSHRVRMRDFVEDLTGIARIDVEIR